MHNYRAGPRFLWDKGMGDLPNSGWTAYLRPFALQGDCGLLPTAGNPQSAAVRGFPRFARLFLLGTKTTRLGPPLTLQGRHALCLNQEVHRATEV